MDNLFKKQTVCLSHMVLDKQEECAVSGDFTLPEYCPDVSTVLKCLVTPRIQNRQWSGNQLLVDGMAAIRVLYLDEDRRVLHAAEFAQPFSCALHTDTPLDGATASIELTTRYVNCRAVGPRRLEVRGAIVVSVNATCGMEEELAMAASDPQLYTCCETVAADTPMGASEKVLSVSDSLDFPDNLPPAEMLLGGDCKATVRECKVLSGKVIVKGQVNFHQLYTDNRNAGNTYCLDFSVPFSQILDVDGVEDSHPYEVGVSVLSDTERCAVGPDGENSVLEVTAKLLVQFRSYRSCELPMVLDAYHGKYPATPELREVNLYTHAGCRWDHTKLNAQLELPVNDLQEILDIWVLPQGLDSVCEQGVARIGGRMLVCVLARDVDGQIAYYERPEEYRLEYACTGNALRAQITVTELDYRVVDRRLELSISVGVSLCMGWHVRKQVVQNVRLHTDAPYEQQKATLLLYYGQAGEDLWGIGRRCHVSPERIRQENALTEERLTQPSVLLVPVAL